MAMVTLYARFAEGSVTAVDGLPYLIRHGVVSVPQSCVPALEAVGFVQAPIAEQAELVPAVEDASDGGGGGAAAFTDLTDAPMEIEPNQPLLGSPDGAALVFESAYRIGAVHFDGPRTALASTDPLACTDTGAVTASFWIRTRTPVGTNILAVDPAGDYGSEIYYSTSDSAGFALTAYFSSADASKIVQFEDTGRSTYFRWHHVLIAGKSDAASGSKVLKFYIDDIDASGTLQDSDASFNIGLNGKPIFFGDDGDGAGATFDVADFWMSTESVIAGGVVPEATRRKFIDATGKPVDLGANGETPTGTAPVIFFHSEYASDGTDFATNLGTGGAFHYETGSASPVDGSPSLSAISDFTNPMLGAGDLVVGRVNDGFPLRLANPGTGTFALQSIDGVLTWTAVV